MNEKDLKSADSSPIFHIEIDKIKPNPLQPRRDFNEESLKELASSIREFGILQPLMVSKIEKETPTGTEVEYQLIAGERRLMASKMLNWERVPVIIRAVDENRERLELAIIENVQRADLNPLEAARAYARLQEEFRLTQREVAQRIGKSRETIANTLRLLDLPAYIQEALSQSKINESHARALLAVSDFNLQKSLFEELVKSNLSVRELRQRIAKDSGVKTAPTDSDTAVNQIKADPESEILTTQLEEALGARVKVSKEGDRGRILINFYNRDELENILNKILNSKDQLPPSNFS